MKKLMKHLWWVPVEIIAMYTLIAANIEQWNPGFWKPEIKIMFWIVSVVVLSVAIILKNTD